MVSVRLSRSRSPSGHLLVRGVRGIGVKSFILVRLALVNPDVFCLAALELTLRLLQRVLCGVCLDGALMLGAPAAVVLGSPDVPGLQLSRGHLRLLAACAAVGVVRLGSAPDAVRGAGRAGGIAPPGERRGGGEGGCR